MISTLHIKNIGIIDDLMIDLNSGFNVLTGETGAGKTLIIDSLAIISGGRFSKEMIRHGENHSFIECNIFMPDHPYSVDGNVLISREIYSNGRNSCKINGRLVTVNDLKDFMTNMIDIHGQNDNLKLLNDKYHLEYLDGYIGKEITDIKEGYISFYKRYIEIKEELKKNYGDDKEKQRKLDLLKYQLKEIDVAKLNSKEEYELLDKRNMFLNSEKINKNLKETDMLLNETTIDSISMAIKAMEKISDIDSEYDKKLTDLKSVYYEIQEVARDISSMNDDIYFDEEERNDIEERLELITSLKRKYGNSVEEILAYRDEIQKEIEMIDNLDTTNSKLKEELKEFELNMLKMSLNMTKIRNHYAKQLSQQIDSELHELEMKNAHFMINILFDETHKFTKDGLDKVQFFIQTNTGSDAKPLSKIASGGEMSRIMLGIKTIFAKTDDTPILVFDEIDTGISGKAAKVVGEKLRNIGKKHQVFCITHQPSIAAKGEYNYYISKEDNGKSTRTNVKKLNEKEVLEEIARISNGEITKVSLEHALELRKIS